MPVPSVWLNFHPFSKTSNVFAPKITLKYNKNGPTFATSKNIPKVIFETCWTQSKKPHFSMWSRSKYTFLWMTLYAMSMNKIITRMCHFSVHLTWGEVKGRNWGQAYPCRSREWTSDVPKWVKMNYMVCEVFRRKDSRQFKSIVPPCPGKRGGANYDSLIIVRWIIPPSCRSGTRRMRVNNMRGACYNVCSANHASARQSQIDSTRIWKGKSEQWVNQRPDGQEKATFLPSQCPLSYVILLFVVFRFDIHPRKMVFNVLSFNLDVAWLEEVATISIRWRAYRLCADDATYYLRSASSDAKIGRIMNRLKPN